MEVSGPIVLIDGVYEGYTTFVTNDYHVLNRLNKTEQKQFASSYERLSPQLHNGLKFMNNSSLWIGERNKVKAYYFLVVHHNNPYPRP